MRDGTIAIHRNGRTLTKIYDEDDAIGAVACSDPNGLAISASVDPLGNLTQARNAAICHR